MLFGFMFAERSYDKCGCKRPTATWFCDTESWPFAYLHSISVVLSWDVTLEHLKHIFHTSQFFTPHFQQVIFLAPASQIKQVMVLQFAKGWWRWVSPSAIRELVPVWGAVQVTLGSRSPEDGPHILTDPFFVCRWFPWQWSTGSWILAPQSQSCENFFGGNFSIQGVKMQSRNLIMC